MKKLLSAILIVAVLLSLAAPAMAASKVYATGNANLRKGPGLDYATVGSVKKGTALTYKGETSTDSRGVKWYKVSYKSKTCWISSRYASTSKSGSSSSKPSTSAKDKVTTTGSVNIRKGPGLKYDIIASVPKGSSFKYEGETKKDNRGVKWYKVSYDGKTGWISSKNASLNGSSPSSSSSSSAKKVSTSSSSKVTAKANVNLRKGPGTNYGVIASVLKGSTLKYQGESKKDSHGVKWYKVTYDGKTAWISSKYSKLSTGSSSSSSSSSSAEAADASTKQTVPDTGDGSVFSLDPVDGTTGAVQVEKPPIVTEAPAGAIDVSGFYQAKLIETAIMLQIDGYQKMDTELPNQYYNDALTIAGDTNVDYIGLRGEGYTVYGVCVNMDIETAKGLLTAAGLDQVDREWVVGFEHRADENSSVNVNGYDSCINLYADTEGRITEIDWSTYTSSN